MSAPPYEANDPDHCWMPAGRRIVIDRYELEGGLVYVGARLKAVSSWGQPEPALINPWLPLGTRPNRSGQGMPSWPSYSTLPPGCRAAYLEWLARGRDDPGAYIGYVFLFFYGLERRALEDARHSPAARQERGTIAREVERLLDIYGEDASFRRYATGFLSALAILEGRAGGAAPLPRPGEPSRAVALEISRLAREGKPIPGEWALAWALGEYPDPPPRAATQCPRELRELFLIEYAGAHGAGIVPQPRKRPLVLKYRPASASFDGELSLPTRGLTEVATLPLKKLRPLLDACCRQMEPYSRWTPRDRAGREGLIAAAVLPRKLLSPQQSKGLARLQSLLDTSLAQAELATVEVDALLHTWAPDIPGKLTPSEAMALGGVLERLDFGMEPDLRLVAPGPRSGGQVVIFRSAHGGVLPSSRRYKAAAITLQLVTVGARVPWANPGSLGTLLGARFTPSEQFRLRAHILWLRTARLTPSELKPRAATIAPKAREALGRLLVHAAAATGRIGTPDVQALGWLYSMLDLDPVELHCLLGTLPRKVQVSTDEPLTVRAGGMPSGFALPPPPGPRARVTLDMATVQARLTETAEVTRLLGRIFEQAEEPLSAPPPPTRETLQGLDAPHSALLRALAERPAWPRAELKALAARFGLMPDGALDVLNEASLELCGEAVCEGSDPITMNEAILEELSP